MKSNFYESIRVEVFFKIDVLTNFATFKRKWLCQGRVRVYALKKFQASDLQHYSKKNPGQVVSYEICIFFKNTHFEEHLRIAVSVLRGYMTIILEVCCFYPGCSLKF